MVIDDTTNLKDVRTKEMEDWIFIILTLRAEFMISLCSDFEFCSWTIRYAFTLYPITEECKKLGIGLKAK